MAHQDGLRVPQMIQQRENVGDEAIEPVAARRLLRLAGGTAVEGNDGGVLRQFGHVMLPERLATPAAAQAAVHEQKRHAFSGRFEIHAKSVDAFPGHAPNSPRGNKAPRFFVTPPGFCYS